MVGKLWILRVRIASRNTEFSETSVWLRFLFLLLLRTSVTDILSFYLLIFEIRSDAFLINATAK